MYKNDLKLKTLKFILFSKKNEVLVEGNLKRDSNPWYTSVQIGSQHVNLLSCPAKQLDLKGIFKYYW